MFLHLTRRYKFTNSCISCGLFAKIWSVKYLKYSIIKWPSDNSAGSWVQIPGRLTLSLLIKWVLENRGDKVVKSKLSLCSVSEALKQLHLIHKKTILRFAICSLKFFQFQSFSFFSLECNYSKICTFPSRIPEHYFFPCMFFHVFVVLLYDIKFLESSPNMLSVVSLCFKFVAQGCV